ncbi:MAG: hypothetical protein ACI9DH_000816 [Halioglobus sp.]|jgi:hypothetical protein
MSEPTDGKPRDMCRRSIVLLLVGACAGVLLGSLSAFGWYGVNTLSPAVVARVNGRDIEAAEYQRALHLFGSEKREAITDADRTLVLRRMIEEELLLQFGVNSGLVRRNSSVREEALKSILTSLVMELEAGNAPESNGSPGKAHDALLTEYLGQLKDQANIRLVEADT